MPGTFTGKFTSPNGKFSLVVDDNGIFLTTPNSWITMYDGYTDLEIATASINAWHSNAWVYHYGEVDFHYERNTYNHQLFEGYYGSYRYFDGSTYEENFGWHNYFANLEVFNFKNP